MVPFRPLPRPFALVAGLLAGVLLVTAGDADAQRRRRRRRPPSPPAAEAPATPPEAPADGPEQDLGDDAPSDVRADPTLDPSLPPGGAELAPLREELADVLDQLVQTRGRITALGQQLFRTKVRLRVENHARDRQSLARLTLVLDGDPVFEVAQGSGAEELTRARREVYEGFAAPGPHVLRVEVEQRAQDDRDVRYILRDTYRFEARRRRRTDVVVILEDDSNLAESYADDGAGHFDVRTKVRIRTDRLPSSPGGGGDDGSPAEGDDG